MKHGNGQTLILTALAFGVMYYIAGPIGVCAVLISLFMRG